MRDKVVVWFAGFGWERMTLNKVAFTLFDRIEVRWYGILITLGIVLAFLYAAWRGKRNEGIISDDVLDVGISTVLCGIVGARLYYVLTSLDEFPTLGSAFAIWNGGLGIYGGIIGGALGIYIACRIKKLKWQKLFDMITPGVIIAQSLGRWGNFFNGEAYGYRIADTTQYFFFTKELALPSGEGTLFHFFRMGLFPNMYSGYEMVFVHPTFLYESIWNLIGFILLNIFYKRKRFDGQVALMYFTWYGFGRMFIEGLRTDSLYIFKGLISDAGLRISQCIGLLCFVGGLFLLIWFSVRCKPATPEFITVRDLPVRRRTEDGEVQEELAPMNAELAMPAAEQAATEAEAPAEQTEETEATEETDMTQAPAAEAPALAEEEENLQNGNVD